MGSVCSMHGRDDKCHQEMVNAIKNLVRHFEIQKLLGRCRRRRE